MDEFTSRLDAAIDGFSAAAEELKTAPSDDAAEEACLACREAVQLFFFVHGDYGEEALKKTDKLLAAIDDTENVLKELADEQGDESLVSQYLENVQRRKHLVDALLENNVARIKDILKLTSPMSA